jgi:hypothetical protein
LEQIKPQIVEFVRRGSAAFDADLLTGDVVLSIAGQDFSNKEKMDQGQNRLCWADCTSGVGAKWQAYDIADNGTEGSDGHADRKDKMSLNWFEGGRLITAGEVCRETDDAGLGFS